MDDGPFAADKVPPERIVKRALALLADRRTLFLDGGSGCLLLLL